MNSNTRNLTRYACSAIALMVTASALPAVPSGAFSIKSAHRIKEKAPGQNRRDSNPNNQMSLLRQNRLLDTVPLELYSELTHNEKAENYASKIAYLRGGGDCVSMKHKIGAYVSKNFFLLGMIVAVSFAKLYPELGKNGSVLRPELFIGKYGVTTIFLLSGISLKLQELTNAVSNTKLNGLIQLITFGAWPYLVGLPMTKGIELLFPGLLPTPLIEGLLILCCLPTTINMCIILTSASGGSGKYLHSEIFRSFGTM